MAKAKKNIEETPAEKPAKVVKAAAPAKAWGISDLVKHVNEACGTSFDAYNLRILLRKMTKDGVIERGEGRYAFDGPKDATVVAIIKAVKSGAADKAKAERLESLKEKKAASKGKAKKVVEEVADEDDDALEDVEDDDLDLDDDDE